MTRKNNGWIAVSKQLPAPDTPVWAGWFNANGTFAFGLFIRFLEDGEWKWARCGDTRSQDGFGDWEADGDYSHITHWQPLPAPPKAA